MKNIKGKRNFPMPLKGDGNFSSSLLTIEATSRPTQSSTFQSEAMFKLTTILVRAT